MAIDIHVYGTDWCGLTFRVRKYLMHARIPYAYHDVERDPAADEFVRTMKDGKRHFPIVVVEDCIVTNPTLSQLEQMIDDYRVRGSAFQNGPRLRR
jgi:mycoredoxin